MKLAFLVTKRENPSARYRVIQYAPLLKEAGHVPEVFAIPEQYGERFALFRRMRFFDVVLLQRKLLNVLWWRLLRRSAGKLVYDFDDAIMFKDPLSRDHVSRGRMRAFLRTARDADLVIAGNEYLKSLAENENTMAVVIPTSVDLTRYTERPPAAESDSAVIGWIGSKSTLFYLEGMRRVLDRIHDRIPHARLKIVADRFFQCERMPVIKKPWRYEEEIDDLHSFDVGLMPLTDDPWSRGKCGFKLLQYMAVGIPAVCSPVGVNREIVVDGENGFWANDESEWVEKVSELLTNHRLRVGMGRRAREKVIERYSTETSGKRLIEILERLETGVRH